MTKAVIAWTMYGKAEWALVLTACREQDGSRAIYPMVFALPHSPLFAGFPGGGEGFSRARSTDDHKGTLQLLIEGYIAECSAHMQVLEAAQVSFGKSIEQVIYTMRNGIPETAALPVVPDPALDWIIRSKQSGPAESAGQLVRFLARKHGLDSVPHGERAEIDMQQILGKGKVTECRF